MDTKEKKSFKKSLKINIINILNINYYYIYFFNLFFVCINHDDNPWKILILIMVRIKREEKGEKTEERKRENGREKV